MVCDDICDNGDPGVIGDAPDNTPGGGGGGGILTANGKTAAVAYANKYWSTWNTTTYPDLKSTNDDCTDFISQAMKAGGWKSSAIGSPYNDDHHWWYSTNDNNASGHFYSHSWTSATAWRAFSRNEGWVTQYTNSAAAVPGDVFQIDVGNDGSMDHTMIVTGMSGSEPLLSAHTNNRHNMPLSTYRTNAQNQNPGKTIKFLYYST